MEEPRSLSPTPDQVQKSTDEKQECQNSPTTVTETESVSFTETFPSSDVSVVAYDDAPEEHFVNTNYKNSAAHPLVSNELSKEERVAKLRRKRLERRKYLNNLPTIQEISTDDEREGEVKSVGLALLSEADDILLHIQTLSESVNSVNDLKEVQHRIDDASQRASRGNEEKALVIYKDVLVILEKELTRISEQIKVLSTKQPKFEKSKLYIMLHKEWAENALIVADIMSRMATIYERQEKYEAAQCCVEEARAIYQRHATFDEQHNKNGSSSREKEMSMELMMDQIEEATESHCLRQSLHETIERIREKIAATADETSRGFLYEDIFDKLSTVLSLELMYLGDNHPQIANSKGLFGKFYGEINQNEKALKAMNDAILICEKALGELHPQTGSKYQDAARLYDRIGGEENYSKAIDLYEKAISNFEKSEGNVSEKLCSSLNKVAILYIERKSYDIAIKKLESAIHISEENYRERSDDASTEPIQLWLNLGECHALKGKPSLATEAYRNALRIQRDKRKVHDLLPRKGSETIPGLISNSKITFTLKKLGQSLAVESKFEESYGYFMEALTILRGDLKVAQESGLFDPTVDLPGREDDVASALYDLAKAKQSDAKYEEASEFYKECLELRKQSDKKRAVIERSNNINCAICLAGIGSIELVQNNDSDAFKSFNQAIYYARQEGIPDSDPIARMLWEKSRMAANKMNKVQKSDIKNYDNDDIVIFPLELKAKEFREARAFESSIKIINTVIGMKRVLVKKVVSEEQEQRTKATRQLAASLIFKGELALMMGEKKDAKDCINEASGLLKECGVDKEDEHYQQIEQVHSKIGNTKRLKNIAGRIRKMKRRSESTMAEF